MSARDPQLERLTDSVYEEEDFGVDDNLVPKLVQYDDEGNFLREFQPNVVTALGGTLPWQTNSTQLQCGDTITENSGDMNFRLNYECVCDFTELNKLQRMRSQTGNIRLVSNFYSGPATFDELVVQRIADANGAVVRGEGEEHEPRYRVQLQSKEENEGSDT